VLLRNSTTRRRKLPSPSSSSFSCVAQKKKGDGNCRRLLRGATAQLHSMEVRSCRRLLLPLFLTLHKEEEEEEGDGNYRHLLRGATLQCYNSSTT